MSEAIQTVLRREGFPKPYEALKDLTRTNEKITKESISNFIDGLDVNDEIKDELKKISPFNFTGVELFWNISNHLQLKIKTCAGFFGAWENIIFPFGDLS